MWAAEEYGGAGIADLRYEQIVAEENIRYGDVGFYSNHALHDGRALYRQAGYGRTKAALVAECDARVTRIFAGSNEIMKEIIGRGLGLDERKMT